MDVSTPYDTIRDAPLRADTLKEAIDSIADRTPTPPNREMMRLRDMLDERGIEWWPSDDPCCKDAITHWRVGPFQWTAIEGEKDLWLNAGIAGHEPLTPEQAIAATVGNGTDLASRLREVTGLHAFAELFGFDWHDESDWDWHDVACAMADAIDATVGVGTCQIETTESWLPAERYHRCKHCGAFFAVLNASHDIPPRACPNCGRKVVGA